MDAQVQAYIPEPTVALGHAQTAQINYMGLRSWAMQGIVQARAITMPFGAHPAVVRDSITDTVGIIAAHALGSALGKLEIIETCGRVVLVAVEEHYIQRDPIIPLALVNLGNEYNRAFTSYVRHIARFHTDQSWWNKAQKLCSKTINALQKVADVLSAEELAYLAVKLQVPLAWPQGREEMERDSLNPYSA